MPTTPADGLAGDDVDGDGRPAEQQPGTGNEGEFGSDRSGGEAGAGDVGRQHLHAELVLTYEGLPLGTTDATVITLCERLGLSEVATLDRRHFTVVRPRHVEALTLLPD